MTNVAIWQRANGRFAMVAFWILVASYLFTGQIVPGIF